MKLLFLRRADCDYSDRAEARLRELFDEVEVIRSSGIGDKLPEQVRDYPADALFAFRSHIIVPGWLIERTPVCLNFHPGPPERPGIGCVNFALFEGDSHYGSTCHYIVEEVDAGPIVSVRRFPITAEDTIGSLLKRSYEELLDQLYEVAPTVAEGRKPDSCDEQWARKATRKKDLDRLFEIPLDADPDMMKRQIRATLFGDFRPYIVVNGVRFEFAGFSD